MRILLLQKAALVFYLILNGKVTNMGISLVQMYQISFIILEQILVGLNESQARHFSGLFLNSNWLFPRKKRNKNLLAVKPSLPFFIEFSEEIFIKKKKASEKSEQMEHYESIAEQNTFLST